MELLDRMIIGTSGITNWSKGVNSGFFHVWTISVPLKISVMFV